MGVSIEAVKRIVHKLVRYASMLGDGPLMTLCGHYATDFHVDNVTWDWKVTCKRCLRLRAGGKR